MTNVPKKRINVLEPEEMLFLVLKGNNIENIPSMVSNPATP
jgi:hypothetical protein